MKKIYTLLAVTKCFGEYKGKSYKHDKGVFLVTSVNDDDIAISQNVENIKLSPRSSFTAPADIGYRGTAPAYDEFGRLVTFYESP